MSTTKRCKVDFYSPQKPWTTRDARFLHKTKNSAEAKIKWEREAQGKRRMDDLSEWLLKLTGLIFVSFWGHPTVPVRYYGVQYDEDSWELVLATVAYEQDPSLKRKHQSWATDPRIGWPHREEMSRALIMIDPEKRYTIPKVCFLAVRKLIDKNATVP